MARPGIMLYFDIIGPVRVLPDAEKGRLLMAMLEYGQSGVLPEFDGMLEVAWSFVRPMIDRDGERYEDMKLQREYATFCKKRKRIWMPKISFDDWVLMTDNERQRAVDPVGSRITSDNEPFRPDNEQQRAVSSRNPTTTDNSNVQLQSPKSIDSINVQLQSSISNNNSHPQENCGDGEIYEEKKEQRKYAAFCKKRALLGLSKVPFTLWQTMSEAERNRLLEVGEEQRAVDFVNEEQREQRAVDFVASRYPSKAKAETESKSKSKSISEAEAKAKAEGTVGAPAPIAAAVVFLSDDELEVLRKQMGAEMLNHYVGKLATFIRKNGATVNDHCATILKWWREDGCKKAVSGRVPNGASGQLGQAEKENIRRLMQEEV